MLRILESQAPAKQTATDTINTLSSRLSSATLLEDRRAAILGLRSFAKQFPASVASGALRDLLAALRKDGEDSETTKIVLETLLMLFEPDEASPEASEDITLWLADEFTQRQDNITALLDLLETGEFYLRLYSIQIISHVCAARPQRTHEAVLAAPLGVSRITAVLDERREAVRNEALLLLVALTPDSAELQKVVAFENAFDKVFALMESEGGLTHGSTVVQDCLSLLANLLSMNSSNQSYFREMGGIKKVSKLLADVVREEKSEEGVSEWVRPQRDMNLWGMLAVIQLFLIKGSQGTIQAQMTLWQSTALIQILQIAFHPSFGINVRSKSLDVCGDIIRGNAGLQEQFGDLAVELSRTLQNRLPTNGHTTPAQERNINFTTSTPAPAPVEITNVIEALLQLALEPAPLAIFDVRLSACNCMKAFMEGHQGIRGHVLRRAIEGHASGDDAIPNILTVLLEPPSTRSTSDPYQVWMASVLLLHLLYDNSDIKAMAMKVSEGNSEEGEEVVTFIQSLTSNVVAGVQHVEDERALLGHLMLLCTWLFEDPEAVDDLLGEGTNVQGLIAAVKVASISMPLVAGLCSLLLGIVYEFSTKDSPISRSTLSGVMNKNLTREVYIDRLTKLRESPFVRDFEVLPTSSSSGLPNVYFDKTFINFLKDNFSRFLRAIDRDPTFEASIVSNGVQKGISRELVDNLKAELDEQKRISESQQTDLLQLRQKFEQEVLEHRRTKESTTVELGRIKTINETLHRNHEEETTYLQRELRTQLDALTRNHDGVVAQIKRDHLAAVEDVSQRHLAEKKYLEQRQSGHEREMSRLKENMTTQHKVEFEQFKSQTSKVEAELRKELVSVRKILTDAQNSEAEYKNSSKSLQTELEATRVQSSREKEEFNKKINQLEKELAEQARSTTSAQEKVSTLETRAKTMEQILTTLEFRAQKAESHAKTAEDRLKKAEEKSSTLDLKVKELLQKVSDLESSAVKAKDVQTELDDLLVVFADLEAKREVDKAKLKELGQEVSDDEDDDVGDDDEAEEEDEDEDEDDGVE